MAKKKIGLKSTLKKNQGSDDLALPTMKTLPKVQKDLEDMREAVDVLHQNEKLEEAKLKPKEQPKPISEEQINPIKSEKQAIQEPIVEKRDAVKSKNTSVKQINSPNKPKPEKLKRLTIDLDKRLHKLVKLRCDENEVSMRAYIIGLIETDIKKKKR